MSMGAWIGWLPQRRDLLATDIGHAMVRMQHAVFADRGGLTSAAGQPLGDLLAGLRLVVARRRGHGWR
jgi:hypothetical protein